MTEQFEPSLNRRKLSMALRSARQAAGKTQNEAAEAMECSLSKLIRIEKGTFSVSVIDLRALLQLYGVTDPRQVAELEGFARGSKRQSWWAMYNSVISPGFAEYLGFEGAATILRCYHPFLVPGLLQTEEYAKALVSRDRPPEEATLLVELKISRQERIFDELATGELFFLLDESALHRRVGDPAAMREQLRRLRNLTRHPRTHLHVLPFSAGTHPDALSPFTLLEFEESADLLYQEAPSGRGTLRDIPQLTGRFLETFWELEDMSVGGAHARELIDEAAEQFAADAE
ncbi:helix-turn-helix domain-containing protein [Streptomyces sp. NPDC059009]|uniref:helix-turn-helix domain-containing protein n=1 Tax=Streptomyces sp. NPDC059009 TaxID=3346694 RepID=UPI0036AFC049